MSAISNVLAAGAIQPVLSPITYASGVAAPGKPWTRIVLNFSSLQTETGTGILGGNPSAGYPNGSLGVVTRFPAWSGLNANVNFFGNYFEVMCSVISGTSPDPAQSDALDTWLQIISGRQWVCQTAFPPLGGSSNTVLRISVRRRQAAGSPIILAQSDFTSQLSAVPP